MASWAASAADDDAGAPSFADDDNAIGAIDRDRIENIEWIRVFGVVYLVVYTLLTTEFGHGRVRSVYPRFLPTTDPHCIHSCVYTHRYDRLRTIQRTADIRHVGAVPEHSLEACPHRVGLHWVSRSDEYANGCCPRAPEARGRGYVMNGWRMIHLRGGIGWIGRGGGRG